LLKLNGPTRILVLGYGNSDWLDEGLGPALAEAIRDLGLPDVTVDWTDALNLEDARTIASHDLVIFAGAAMDGLAPFSFRPIRAKRPQAGTRIRELGPTALLDLVKRLYHREPEGYGLTIRGYEFGAGHELSEGARKNLAKAVEFLEAAIRLNPGFTQARELLARCAASKAA
jgi:hydrogenase maturation protease